MAHDLQNKVVIQTAATLKNQRTVYSAVGSDYEADDQFVFHIGPEKQGTGRS
jgi:hypothetical protein